MTSTNPLLQRAKLPYCPARQVLGISGSPRIGGNTDALLAQIISGVTSKNIESYSVNLGAISFSGCIGCEKCRKDKICTTLHDDMSDLYPKIIAAKGLILVSPVHNYNITSWMKAFIDRMYCFYEFDNDTHPRQWSSRLAQQKRKVVIAAVCEQESLEDLGFALEAMEKPMQALGYDVVGSMPVFKTFAKGTIKKQKKTMDAAYDLGIQLGKQL